MADVYKALRCKDSSCSSSSFKRRVSFSLWTDHRLGYTLTRALYCWIEYEKSSSPAETSAQYDAVWKSILCFSVRDDPAAANATVAAAAAERKLPPSTSPVRECVFDQNLKFYCIEMVMIQEKMQKCCLQWPARTKCGKDQSTPLVWTDSTYSRLRSTINMYHTFSKQEWHRVKFVVW